MSRNSSGSRTSRPDRPKKPYPDFPLAPHASGTWQKKIRGKIHYFGRWGKVVDGKMTRLPGDGWKEALDEYKVQADDLHAGRTPRPKTAGLTVADLCNHFLTAKKNKLDAGELTPRLFAEYRATTDLVVAAFGKGRLVDDLRPDDFAALRAERAKKWGPVRLGDFVQKVRSVFKYGAENGLLDRPVLFGSEFKKPSRKTLRLHKAKGGKKMFTRDEVRGLIESAGVPFKAMLLLGINAAFGNTDAGTLPLAALDLEGGWVIYPRPKTGIERRCPLWPETVQALRDALADRPTPKQPGAEGLVFVTKYGNAWAGDGTATAVSHEFGKLLAKLKIDRPGVGYYTLRHTFRTVADATKDPVAIRCIMGHTDSSIDATYTHHIDDARLRAVTDHVRGWLFGSSPSPDPAATVYGSTVPAKPAKNPTTAGESPAPATVAGAATLATDAEGGAA